MIRQKLIELLNKWLCCHNWKLFREIEVEGSFGEIFHEYIFYCTKCGKFKKIRTNDMKYNVVLWDFNKKEFVSYDIFPYLKKVYQEAKGEKPKTFKEFKEFIRKESMYMWWGRCEYEILISDWPSQSKTEKIDVHYQVMMNIDIITKLFMEEINGITSNR